MLDSVPGCRVAHSRRIRTTSDPLVQRQTADVRKPTAEHRGGCRGSHEEEGELVDHPASLDPAISERLCSETKSGLQAVIEPRFGQHLSTSGRVAMELPG